ncbi:MAG: hypothetical protein ACFFBD_03970 [Candidatus Hodarchaeota archaeon]
MAAEQPCLDGIPINQIWIVEDSGLCLFHSSFNNEEASSAQANIFSGFITAITAFAKEVAKSSLRKITMGNMVLHQYKKQDLLICLSAEKEIEETTLTSFFERLILEFKNEFQSLLEDPQGFDMESFEKFQTKLYEILKINMLTSQILYSDKPPSFNLLFIALGRLAEKVITAVIVGEKIALVGDRGDTEILISTLERFSPHKSLKKVYWTNTPLEDADLIGIPLKLEKYYADQGYKILDIKDPGKFIGTGNRFVSKFIKDVKKVDDLNSVEYIIKTRMNYFISRVSTLMDLYTREQVTKGALEILRKDIDKDLFDLLVTYIRNVVDPNFRLLGQKNFWARLDDF